MLPKYIFVQCDNFSLFIMYDILFSDALITSKANNQLLSFGNIYIQEVVIGPGKKISRATLMALF